MTKVTIAGNVSLKIIRLLLMSGWTTQPDLALEFVGWVDVT